VEGSRVFPEAECSETAKEVITVAQVRCDDPDPADQIAKQLGPGPFELVCLFVSPEADFTELVATTAHLFGGADVLACTTAGEIGRAGYEDDQIIAVAFRKNTLKQSHTLLKNLTKSKSNRLPMH